MVTQDADGARLTHVRADGSAHMVDVSGKPVTAREATAKGRVLLSPSAIAALHEGTVTKGDALAVARIAGIQAVKRTALTVQDHPQAGHRDAHARVPRGSERALPRLAHLGQEPGPERPPLVHRARPRVAVVAHGRRRDQRRRPRARHARERLGDQARALHAALEHVTLHGGGPALVTDVGPRQVHHRIGVGQVRRVQHAVARSPEAGVGPDLAAAAHQPHHPHAILLERARQRAPHHLKNNAIPPA